MNNFLGSWLGPGQLCLEDLIKQVSIKLNTTVPHAVHLSKVRPICMIHYIHTFEVIKKRLRP